jgi:hypothetical protein
MIDPDDLPSHIDSRFQVIAIKSTLSLWPISRWKSLIQVKKIPPSPNFLPAKGCALDIPLKSSGIRKSEVRGQKPE